MGAAVERLVGGQRADYLDEAQRLIVACRALMISELRTADPPVSAILQRAGLASRAFYRLFRSKEELVLAVLEDGGSRAVASMRRSLELVADPDERIHVWVAEMVEFSLSVPQAGPGSLLLHAYRFESMFPEQMAAIRDLIIEPLREAIVARGSAVSHETSRAAAVRVYDLVYGALCRAMSRGDAVAGDEVEALQRLALLIAVSLD